MSTITDAIANTLEQKILPTIYESLWDLDQVYKTMARTSFGVKRNEGIGRTWKVLKTWSTGMAGGAKFTSAQGGDVLSGGNNYTMYDTPQTFQGVDEVTAPAFVQTELQLIEHRGNFYLPHQIMRADRLTASIGSVVAQHLKGVAELLALQEAAVWYSTGTTNYELGDIGDTSATCANNAASTAAVDIDLSATNASGRVHRFRPGLMVDLYKSTQKLNVGWYAVIDNVDPLTEKITIKRADGEEFQVTTVLGGGFTLATAGADDSIIVLKDSLAVAPNSLESWIADGSTVTSFLGLAVAQFGQFKSWRATISAALTESVLNKEVGRFLEAFPGKKLDTGLTTMGVLLGFIDNLDGYVNAVDTNSGVSGRMRYDRNGQALDVDSGFEGFKYRFAGRPMEILTSTLAEKGSFYAGRIKNGGIVRYVPPAIPGAKTNSKFGTEVEFIAPLGGAGGYQGIFKTAHAASGASTDMVEAPFLRQWNCMPLQPNFLKLDTITEIWD